METIIIQETDEAVRDVLKIALNEENFIVYTVEKLDDDFLQLIDGIRPHVVMFDFRIGGEESINICRQIKLKYPHLPVLAMSCNNNINEVYARHGFDGYIAKPFDLDLLFRILRRYIPKIKQSS
ncbi:response regulator [Pedobacter sp. GSP4]|uniref:response regulator n=1 Tax=Pedobacter sp. GSP4 TaxID=3453716 RepID=UPI003EE82A54